jgi:hypothetical protein
MTAERASFSFFWSYSAAGQSLAHCTRKSEAVSAGNSSVSGKKCEVLFFVMDDLRENAVILDNTLLLKLDLNECLDREMVSGWEVVCDTKKSTIVRRQAAPNAQMQCLLFSRARFEFEGREMQRKNNPPSSGCLVLACKDCVLLSLVEGNFFASFSKN